MKSGSTPDGGFNFICEADFILANARISLYNLPEVIFVVTGQTKIELSCGAVVFTKDDNDIKYVIIESKQGVFGFPKGHTENYETEKETALREVWEETGLSVNIVDGFRVEDKYSFIRNGVTVLKTVIYFLAEYSNQTPVVQETELNSIRLMNFETALKTLPFENTRNILKDANTFIRTGDGSAS